MNKEPAHIKKAKAVQATQVSPKVDQPEKISISSISFDKNGNLYGVSGSEVYVFSFDTKKWSLL